MVADNVNHPKHYNSHPSGVECITITEHMNFNVGNAVKYLWRAGLKTPSVGCAATEVSIRHQKTLEDLKKARWYVDREIKLLEAITIGVDMSSSGDNTMVVRLRKRGDGTIEIIDTTEKASL